MDIEIKQRCGRCNPLWKHAWVVILYKVQEWTCSTLEATGIDYLAFELSKIRFRRHDLAIWWIFKINILAHFYITTLTFLYILIEVARWEGYRGSPPKSAAVFIANNLPTQWAIWSPLNPHTFNPKPLHLVKDKEVMHAWGCIKCPCIYNGPVHVICRIDHNYNVYIAIAYSYLTANLWWN